MGAPKGGHPIFIAGHNKAAKISPQKGPKIDGLFKGENPMGSPIRTK